VIANAFEHIALVDTSAVLALHDPAEPFHQEARRFFATESTLVWASVDVTSHECFTRVRYRSTLTAALEHYAFLRSSSGFQVYRFSPLDEDEALRIVARYSDQHISFHDALCAAVMKRIGIIKVFTFDRDFAIMGFITLPGQLG
jgi:predicted nucleic acid-binding protein